MRAARRLISLLAILAFQNIVWAQSVGRAEVKDLPDGWTQLVAYDMKALTLDGGRDQIPQRGTAFLNKPRNMLLIVESTAGHRKTIHWVTMKCPEIRDGYFTNDYGTNQNSRDTRCLVVNAKYSDKKYLATVSPQTAEAVEREGLRFDKGQLIRTWIGIKSGSYLKIYLFKTSAFQTESTSGKDGPSDVDQSLIAFGESLQKLAYESILSVNGNLSLQLLNAIK